MRTCSQLQKKFLMAKFVFVRWFVQVNRQKITVKKKITENYCKIRRKYFLKNYVSSLLTVFENVLAICNFFFTARCLDVRLLDLLYFICLKFNPQYCYLQKQSSRVFLGIGVLKICTKFTGQHTCLKCDFNNVSLQIYWN